MVKIFREGQGRPRTMGLMPAVVWFLARRGEKARFRKRLDVYLPASGSNASAAELMQ